MLRTLAILLLALPAHAAEKERVYQKRFCAGMQLEAFMDNGTKADCVSGRLAIEVEFVEKWKEALGQSLSYAASTQHMPAIILVCQPKKTETPRATEARCDKFFHRLSDAATDERWRIPLTVWRCRTTDTKLSDCPRDDLPNITVQGSKSRANHP
jgi:hypothetical protein